MEKNIVVRKASFGDVPFVANSNTALWDFHDRLIPKFLTYKRDARKIFEKYCRRLIRSKNGVVFVALWGGEKVGCLLAERQGLPPIYKGAEKMFTVTGFYVSEKFRGGGIGKALLWEAEKEFKKKGAKSYLLGVNPKNPRAKSFYNRVNFEEFETILVKEL